METKKSQTEWCCASWWTFIFLGSAMEKTEFFNLFLSPLLKLHLIRKHFWDAKGDHCQQRNGIPSVISCLKWHHTAEYVQDVQLTAPAAAGNVKPNLECCWAELAFGGHRSGEEDKNLTEGKEEERNGQEINCSWVFAKWRSNALLF